MTYREWAATNKDAIQATSSIISAVGIVFGAAAIFFSCSRSRSPPMRSNTTGGFRLRRSTSMSRNSDLRSNRNLFPVPRSCNISTRDPVP